MRKVVTPGLEVIIISTSQGEPEIDVTNKLWHFIDWSQQFFNNQFQTFLDK